MYLQTILRCGAQKLNNTGQDLDPIAVNLEDFDAFPKGTKILSVVTHARPSVGITSGRTQRKLNESHSQNVSSNLDLLHTTKTKNIKNSKDVGSAGSVQEQFTKLNVPQTVSQKQSTVHNTSADHTELMKSSSDCSDYVQDRTREELSNIMLEIGPLLQEIPDKSQQSVQDQQADTNTKKLELDKPESVNKDNSVNKVGNPEVFIENDVDKDDSGYIVGNSDDCFEDDIVDYDDSDEVPVLDLAECENRGEQECAKILYEMSKSKSQDLDNDEGTLSSNKKRNNGQKNKQVKTASANNSIVKQSKQGSKYPRRHAVKDGTVCFAQVGKGAKLWTQEHPLIRGIYLNKGKRDVKRHLVKMKRQPSAVDTGSYLRNGKINDKNRIDDFFEYTKLGLERRRQFEENQARDEYVVNWYMWCPGHGNCLRKCGGYGKCVEGKISSVV